MTDTGAGGRSNDAGVAALLEHPHCTNAIDTNRTIEEELRISYLMLLSFYVVFGTGMIITKPQRSRQTDRVKIQENEEFTKKKKKKITSVRGKRGLSETEEA